MKKFYKEFIVIFSIVLFSAAFYAVTLRGAAGNPDPVTIKQDWEGDTKPFELSPERGRFAHVMSLAENNSYALTKELADFVYPDLGYSDGKFFSFFAPGMSYMAVPFYLIGKSIGLAQVGTFAFVSVISILSLIVLYRIAREIFELKIWSSLFVVLVFAFSTTAWSYAITLYQHHVTLFFMLLSFYAVWKYKSNRKWSWIWGLVVWACYALAITIDYPNLILLFPIILYFLHASIKLWEDRINYKLSFRPAFVLTSIAFLVITAWHLNHNQVNFGSWRKLSGELISYKTVVENHLENAPDIEDAAVSIKGEKNAVTFFEEENLPQGLSVLSFSTDRGLYLFAPILLLSFFGMAVALKKYKTEYGVILFLIAVNVFLYASWGDQWGGWAFGPRYLIPTMAFSSLFVGAFVQSLKYSVLKRVLAFLLFAYSSAIALLGALTTNAIPPKIEAIPLQTGYNFMRNLVFFRGNRSGSFVYNTYFSGQMDLLQYSVIIYFVLIVLALVVLFLIPRYEHDQP
jgi:hypothetical protein